MSERRMGKYYINREIKFATVVVRFKRRNGNILCFGMQK